MDADELRNRRREAMLDAEAGKLATMVVEREEIMQTAILLLESPHPERSLDDRVKLAANVLRRGLA